jgi:ubiquinone/menaquinone biosynthesis C-methylase UbiE
LPLNDEDASKFESSYVHQVYNQIADHFSNTRHSAWPGVVEFIQSLKKDSVMLDIGCGNGKYLNLRNDIFAVYLFDKMI